MSSDIEIFQPQGNNLAQFSHYVLNGARLPERFADHYLNMLSRAIAEFPPVEGYEVTHQMLVERAIYFYCKQQADEAEPGGLPDFKRYRANFSSWVRTCESLLKEAHSISAEVTFKHNFVRQVVEIIDRCLPESESKRTLIRELAKLATTSTGVR